MLYVAICQDLEAFVGQRAAGYIFDEFIETVASVGVDNRVGMQAKAVNRVAALALCEWDFLSVAESPADAVYGAAGVGTIGDAALDGAGSGHDKGIVNGRYCRYWQVPPTFDLGAGQVQVPLS